MLTKEITILFEDADILVCEKPAGIPSQSDKTSDYDMVNRLKNYLFQKNPKAGEPYIGLVHRLDRPVGGVMVFAKTKAAARALSESIRSKEMSKNYLAILNFDGHDELLKEPQLLTDYIKKDGRTNLSKITESQDKEGKKAELLYVIKAAEDGLSLAEITLLTGRHHQIRVQMAAHLGGILGDTKYNPLYQNKPGFYKIGLYAYKLEFAHPNSKKLLSFEFIPIEEPFVRWTEQIKE